MYICTTPFQLPPDWGRRGGSYMLSIWEPEMTLTQPSEIPWYDKQKTEMFSEFSMLIHTKQKLKNINYNHIITL